MRQGQVVVDGVRSPVVEWGPEGAADAAVFVHGNPGSTDDWALLAERTGEHGRAIALDMPGFGRADKPAGFDYTVEGYARHLQGALEQLGVERAHLVLHDFGGPWGLRWASDHPDAFASVVLVNTGVLLDYKWHVLARIWRTRGAGELFMRTTTRSGLKLALRRGQPTPLPADKVEAMYQASRDRGTQRAVLSLYRATDPASHAEPQARLRALDRPALVVWGVADPYIKVEQAERQRETFPSARVVRLDGCGHWPMFDDPERLAGVVVPFLAQRLAATPQAMS